MTGGIYHLYDGIYLIIYLGMFKLHGIYLLDILLIPWYIPWYIAKVVYTTFGVVYTMTQPSRWTGRAGAWPGPDPLEPHRARAFKLPEEAPAVIPSPSLPRPPPAAARPRRGARGGGGSRQWAVFDRRN